MSDSVWLCCVVWFSLAVVVCVRACRRWVARVVCIVNCVCFGDGGCVSLLGLLVWYVYIVVGCEVCICCDCLCYVRSLQCVWCVEYGVLVRAYVCSGVRVRVWFVGSVGCSIRRWFVGLVV